MKEMKLNKTDPSKEMEVLLGKKKSIKALLKSMKGYQYQLASFYEILRKKYDQIVEAHNLDEVRECLMRLNDAQFMGQKIIGELVHSEKRMKALSADNGWEGEQKEPVIVIPQHAKKVADFAKRTKELQKEIHAICTVKSA
tara:strand:+ start:147878 stop:148300 length:423 start_codon:yes stop_codon:yes gene_type:complete